MSDLPPERETFLRQAPYVNASAAELAAAVSASKGVHAAAISSAVNIPKSVGGAKKHGWQYRVMDMDENGPGFVGWMLDAKALIASLAPAVTQEQQPDGSWARCDDALVHAAAHKMNNEEADTPELVSQWYRYLDSVGECWSWFDEGMNGIQVQVGSVNQVEWVKRGDDSFAAILTRPDQNKNSPGVEWVSAEWMMRSWVKSGKWPGLAYSSFKRALPDIERYVATRRNIVRVLNSRLVTNGILHFHIAANSQMVNPSTSGANTTGVPRTVDDFVRMTGRAISDDNDVAGVAPFPTWGDKAPEWIEIGRFLDKEALAAEDAALRAIGRDVNFPLQLLLNGPGAGNHWSDIFLNETFLMQDVASTLSHTYRDITKGPFRRVLSALFEEADTYKDPRKYRLWYDLSEVAKRPDDTAEVLDAYAAGLLSARAARSRLNISEAEAPAVGEVPTRNMLSNRVSTNTMPSAPKTKYAAIAAPPETDFAAVTDELNAIDQQLFTDLDNVAQDTVRSIVVAAGAAALAAIPQGDPLRGVLLSLEPEEVWASVPPHLRQYVDITAISQTHIPGAAHQAELRLSAAAVLILAVFANSGLGAPRNLPGLVAAGVAAYVASLVLAVATRLRNLPSTPRDRWAPSAVARGAMEAATGAVPMRDPDGMPQLADGTWVGGSGPATGPYSVYALLDAAPTMQLEYTWVHDDPPRPFQPHVRLDGRSYTEGQRRDALRNPASFPGPVFFPGDHNGCRCTEEISLAMVSA